MDQPLKIEVVGTGNELLDGSIVDTNTQKLATVLKPLGLVVGRVTLVPDTRVSITQAIGDAIQRSSVVIVSGGLGPTSDDLTLETVAYGFGKKMIFSKIAEKNVLNRLKFLKRSAVNAGNKKQMWIPEGAKVLTNKEGTAPGIQLNLFESVVFFLPGVPREYQYILNTYLQPYFKNRAVGIGLHLFVIKTFGYAESVLNEIVHSCRIPSDVDIGFRTSFPENHIKLMVKAKSRAEAEKKIRPLVGQLKRKLGLAIFSCDNKSFEESIFNSLLKQKTVVAIAESCTGGLVSAMLTKIPGSSKIMDRSFITYSNEAKNQLLNVSSKLIEKHGAVSEEVVRAMASGALKLSAAQKTAAISGIAGPTGGTKEKPVGTVWIAVSNGKKTLTHKLQLPYDREFNQKYSAYKALVMLRDL